MDELRVYNGAFVNGSDIDAALIRAMTPASAAASGSNELASSGAVYAAAANEIIKVTVTGITGTGSAVSGYVQFPVPSGSGYYPRVTADHEVIKIEFSATEIVFGSWTIETGTDSLAYSVTVNGTTDMTVYLGRIGGSLPQT